MRTTAIMIFSVLLGTSAYAQKDKADYGADSVQCVQCLSVYYEFYRQQNYADAYNSWQCALRICPASKKSLYVYGSTIMQHRIKNEKDKAARRPLIDSLYLLYDMRIEHFGQEHYVKGQKAAKMFQYDQDKPELAFPLFKESVDGLKGKSSAGTLSGYYQSLYAIYEKDESKKAQLVQDYVLIMEYIDGNIQKLKQDIDAGNDPKGKKAKKLEGYEMAKSNVNELFYKVADCASLNSVVKEVLDNTDDSDMETRQKMLAILNKQDCTESATYLELAKQICEVEPDHGCSYSIGMIHFKKHEFGSAAKFFKQAVDLCTGCEDKERYLLRAGQAANLSGQSQTAYNYAQQLLKLNPNSGDAYILMGDAILGSRSSCAADDEKMGWGLYWLATDKYERARSVDSEVASKAAGKIATCKAQYPTKEKLFFYSIKNGDSFTVGCWLNQNTTARTQ